MTTRHGFPDAPVDGQQHKHGVYTYTWNERKEAWQVSADSLGRFIVSWDMPARPLEEDLWWDCNTDTLKVFRRVQPGILQWVDNTVGRKYNHLDDRLDQIEHPRHLGYQFRRTAYGTNLPNEEEIMLGRIKHRPSGGPNLDQDNRKWEDYDMVTLGSKPSAVEDLNNALQPQQGIHVISPDYFCVGDQIKLRGGDDFMNNYAIYEIVEVKGTTVPLLILRFIRRSEVSPNTITVDDGQLNDSNWEYPPRVGEEMWIEYVHHPEVPSYYEIEKNYLNRAGVNAVNYYGEKYTSYMTGSLLFSPVVAGKVGVCSYKNPLYLGSDYSENTKQFVPRIIIPPRGTGKGEVQVDKADLLMLNEEKLMYEGLGTDNVVPRNLGELGIRNVGYPRGPHDATTSQLSRWMPSMGVPYVGWDKDIGYPWKKDHHEGDPTAVQTYEMPGGFYRFVPKKDDSYDDKIVLSVYNASPNIPEGYEVKGLAGLSEDFMYKYKIDHNANAQEFETWFYRNFDESEEEDFTYGTMIIRTGEGKFVHRIQIRKICMAIYTYIGQRNPDTDKGEVERREIYWVIHINNDSSRTNVLWEGPEWEKFGVPGETLWFHIPSLTA